MMVDMQGESTTDDGAPERSSAHSVASVRIVSTNLAGTAVFVITAVLASVVFENPWKVLAVVVALVLFSVGVITFIWSYWTAVQRSRTDNIAVAQLYMLAGRSTPRSVKIQMNFALLTQVVAALATAISRSSTDGRPGSTLAFGILVPMFGLGLNGLWCSKFGSFSPRQMPNVHNQDTSPGVPLSYDEMEQNSSHG